MRYIDYIKDTLNKSYNGIICPFKYAEYCIENKTVEKCHDCPIAQKQYTSIFGDNSNVKNI